MMKKNVWRGCILTAAAAVMTCLAPLPAYASLSDDGPGVYGVNGNNSAGDSQPASSNPFAGGPGVLGPAGFVDGYGNPVTGAVAKGITVTKYQNRASEAAGGIDWQQVKASGISFAMVRMGYYNDLDPYYHTNMQAANEAGIKTGVFLYTQALDVQTAIDEANFVLSQICDYPIGYPVAYDVESKVILDAGLTKQQITDQINAFCQVIADAGYVPIVYANNEWLTSYIDSSQIPYDIWYARYGENGDYPNRTIWQCTQEGHVNGIEGNVTIEYAFVDYNTIIQPK